MKTSHTGRGVLAVTLALAAVALPRCGDQSRDQPALLPLRPALREIDFAQDKNLAAVPGQVVVLELEAADGPRENVFRYSLPAGTHRFCVGGDLTRLTVQGPDGKMLADIDRQTGCVELDLDAGVYRVGAWHDGAAVTGANRVAFASVPERRVRLLADCPQDETDPTKCTPKKGYWPLLLDPKSDPTGQNRAGRIHNGVARTLDGNKYCTYSPEDGSGCMPSGAYHCAEKPLVADYTSQQAGDDALFDLGLPQVDRGKGPNVFALKAALTVDVCLQTGYQYPLQSNQFGYGSEDLFNYLTPLYHFGLYVDDLARKGGSSYTIRLDSLFEKNRLNSLSRGFVLDAASVLVNAGAAGSGTTFTVPFRFLPAGTTLDPLEEGEVALFQESNCQGKATVFVADTPDFAALTSPTVTLDNSTKSVKVGPNTAAVLFPDADYKGAPLILPGDQLLPVGGSATCLDATLAPSTSSLHVRSLVSILQTEHACPGCDLTGVDLTGLDLTGVNLSGAILTGGAHLDGATLSGAHLENARLDGATLKKAILKTDSQGRPANLEGATLTKAVLSGAVMHQAILVNADLSGATLDSAELNGAQLTKAELSGSNMSNAKLNPDSTLTPPVPNGASLEGAHLKNVNLSGAQLTGANFKDASFYGENQLPKDPRACKIDDNGFTAGCASAAGAKALGTEGKITDFTDAFLFAVDFGGATLVDVDFSNAVLVDTSFRGASPTSPNAAGFSSAHIQGADLGGATGISLQNAYVDFSPKGNVVHVLLNGDHTQFRGWGKPGQDVCAEVGYDGPSKVPDGSTIKCPNDGLAGPCGATTKENTRWASATPIENATPPAWYVFHAATYTDPAPDPPENCVSKEEAW